MPFDSTPTTNPVVETLTRARERLRRGWCQGAYVTVGGSVCAIGAIFGGHPDRVRSAWTPKRFVHALSVLYEILKPDGTVTDLEYHRSIIERYNDATDRTQGEVLDLFDRAIERARIAVYPRNSDGYR